MERKAATPDNINKDGLSGGAIAGIVVACVVVAAAIITMTVYFFVIRKKNHVSSPTPSDVSYSSLEI